MTIEKNQDLLPNARTLRKNMTPQEHKLWYHFLRSYPIKFYKQKIIENYIVDFYCTKAKLVIEIDGSQHYEPKEMEYDQNRTKVLEKYGLMVKRYSNREVSLEFDLVCRDIHNTVCQRIGYDPFDDSMKET